jgi:hypothetical protein
MCLRLQFLGDDIYGFDVRMRYKQFFSTREESLGHLTINMSTPAILVIERIEYAEGCWPHLEREPPCRSRFRLYQRTRRSQELFDLSLFAGPDCVGFFCRVSSYSL